MESITTHSVSSIGADGEGEAGQRGDLVIDPVFWECVRRVGDADVGVEAQEVVEEEKVASVLDSSSTLYACGSDSTTMLFCELRRAELPFRFVEGKEKRRSSLLVVYFIKKEEIV